MLKSLSLFWKITLAFMLVAFTTAALVAIFIRITSADRLVQLIIEQQRSRLTQTLSEYYGEHGSWQGIATQWQQIQSRNNPTPQIQSQNPPPGGNHGPRNFLGLADTQGIVIVSVDPQQYPDGSKLPSSILSAGTPITSGGKQVGTILTARQPPEFGAQESQFLQRTNQALLFSILGAMVIALLVGTILARTLIRPIQALTQATQKITQGQIEQEVKVTSNDEIGQLASAFNTMSREVARVNQLRRQMTADIAHDLRTPLTVISGYIEAMQDGVLKPTPKRLALIYSEIERLQNLVGDLRMLSLADAGELSLNPQNMPPKIILDRAAALFRHLADQQNVSISVSANDHLPEIYVDEARMMQIFGNLISNSLRYTPPQGKITLSAAQIADKLEICVEDTGEGIAAEELPYIFDRFHRADKSRHTESNESGLGLAIVKALIDLHGGSIWAESTLGQGSAFHLSFPC